MSLPPAFLDELRTRIGLFSLIGRRVKLVRAGREMKGCCPFHNEKSPSFYVNEDKGFYHCFGCGAHGDAIGFVMAADGLSFIEAVKLLAADAGLPVPEPERSPEQDRRATLQDLVAAAERWYQEQLETAAAAPARQYLERRGVTREQIAAFSLGFAPDSRDSLSRAVLARFPDATAQMLADAGLTGVRDDGGHYDRFRGRLMFPIHDRRGRALGFGGRILGDGEPKYLNSPESPLFDKGRLLFNWHRAAPASRKSGRLLVVEGYMDVVGLAGVGLAEAVAPLGTALTEDQLRLAWTLVPEPVLAFDGDAAGQRAAVRAALRALPLLAPGRSLMILTLPSGQDPDDVARSGGKAAIEALLASALPLGRFLFEAEARAMPLDTPERRAALRQKLRALSADIADEEIRRDYQASFQRLANDLLRPQPAGDPPTRPRGSRRWDGPAALPPLMPETRARAETLSELGMAALLSAVARRAGAAERHAEALADLPIRSPTLAAARDKLLAGQAPDRRLLGLGGAGDPEVDDAEFDRRLGLALASVVELHHIASEMQQPPDCSTADGFARQHERQQALGKAREEAKRRLASIVIEGDGA